MWRTPAVQTSPHRFFFFFSGFLSEAELQFSCSRCCRSLRGSSAGWCTALKHDTGGVRNISLYTIRGYNCTICHCFHRFEQKCLDCGCLQASASSLLLHSPCEGSCRWRSPPGFSRSQCSLLGHLEPPQHLPVFSEPVWTLLIVITGKFHQTVISGPLFKHSGIS